MLRDLRNIARLTVLISAAALLSACGSGSSSPQDSGSGSPTDTVAHRGHALLGPLVNAKVEVYSLATLDGAPIYTTQTHDSEDLDEAGSFTLPDTSLDDDDLYIVKVSGGQDIDADDDGIRDTTPTENKGAIHALLTTKQIRSGGYHVSILTEVLYRRLAYLLSAGYSQDDILKELNYRAGIALKSDINNDGSINNDDVVAWHPRLNQAALRHGFAHYQLLQNKIHTGVPLGSAALYPTDREIASIDLEPFAPQALSVGDGVVGYISFSPPNRNLVLVDISDPPQPKQGGVVSLSSITWLLAAQGKYFFASGAAFHIIDGKNPDTPIEIAFLDLPLTFGANAIYVEGNFAYLVGQKCDIMIINISDLNAPTIAGEAHCSSPSSTVAYPSTYHDGAIYISTDTTLHIFDVSNPNAPALAKNFPVQGGRPMIAKGNYLYAPSDAQINIIDITDIYHPSIVRTDANKGPWLTGLNGNTLFAFGGNSLQAYDISEPTEVKYIGDIATMPSYPWVVVKDGLAYELTVPNNLSIYSLDNVAPTSYAPPLKQLDIPSVSGITINGDLAYLSAQDRELKIMDLADPLEPTERNSITMPFADSTFSLTEDRHSMYGIHNLAQFDISDPTQPSFTGIPEKTNDIYSQASSGNRLYMASNSGYLNTYDISQPQKIKLIGSLDYMGGSANIALNETGTLACLSKFSGELRILDISMPVPSVLKTINLSKGFATCRFHNGYIYVTPQNVIPQQAGKGVSIIDARTTTNPSVVFHLDVNTSWPVLFEGDTAYIEDYIEGSGSLIRIYDVSNPANPVLISSVSGSIYNGVIENHKLYTTETTFDLTDPLNPVNIGTPFTYAISLLHQHITSFTVSGTVVYAVTNHTLEAKSTLYIIDDSNPVSPTLLASFNITPPDPINPSYAAGIWQISINNGIAIFSGKEIGIQAIDVSNLLNPSLVSVRYHPIDFLEAVVAYGSYAYAADYYLGLQVADFTDPTAPKFHKVEGVTPAALAIDGSVVYAANDSIFKTIDVSDPDHPSVLGSVKFTSHKGFVQKLQTINHHAYYVSGNKLFTVDISDPTNPVIAGSTSTLNFLTSAMTHIPAAADGKLYLAHGAAGIEVIDISDPAQPYTSAVIPISAIGAAAKGDYLYVTDYYGVSIIKPMTRAIP